jgi:CheY-like chemotaxis protein
MGYQPDWASDGMELLKSLEHGSYDVVLMDMQMPGMDGLEATRRIRRDFPPERQPHIIALTAAAFPEDRARCLEAGMDDYISKPIDMEQLAAIIGKIAALRNSEPVPRIGA